jgi:hypothetical protein
VLKIDGSGVVLDLTAVSDTVITNVEIIDLTGTGNNTLTVALADVLAISSTTDTLRIDGNGGDIANSDDAGWVAGLDQIIGPNTYHSYTQSTATLLIDTDITQTITP